MPVLAVRTDQIRTIYAQSGPVLLANLLNAAVVAATLWNTIAPALLLSWVMAVVLMTAARLELRRRYLRARPSPQEMPLWGKRFVVGTLVAGALWGGAGVMFFDPDSPIAQILITFSIGGMVAGAAGTLSPYLPAFFAYMLPALVPLFLRMALLGEPLHFAMAGMIAVYAFVLTMVAMNSNRAVTEVFHLRYENEGLLDRLAAAQLTLQQTNRTLEEKVTERTAALERQGEALRSAQRLEAVGRLAGGVAHDFNNLLTVVLGNSSLLLDSRDIKGPDRIAIGEVRDAAERGADLVRQLLAFGGRQRLEPALLDLNHVLGDLRPLLARLITERVELQVDLAAHPLLVVADRSQIEQVVVNLVANARDALPRGGHVLIRTQRDEAFAVLEVADDGVGMDDETRRRAFEPFFTTKALGRGTGLGLATVYGIVEQSGGRIELVSGRGKGSRFVVHLPIGDGAVDAPAPRPTSPVVLGGLQRTVLLAEDDDVVRAVTQRLIEGMGHKVLVADSGERALALSRAHRGPIDVLVTDVVMFAMSGPELADIVTSERPGLRVLLISGYSPEHGRPGTSPSDGRLFLQKPFSAAELREKLDVVCAGRDAALG